MKIFEVFLKTKSDSNIHQNALNCTIYKNSRGNMLCIATVLCV